MTSAPEAVHDASPLELQIDLTAQAAYITLCSGAISRTGRFNDAESVLVDLDAADQPVGIEILGLNTDIPVDALAHAYGFSESLILQLKKFQQSLVLAATTASETTGHALVPAVGPGIPLA